jgi:integrase
MARPAKRRKQGSGAVRQLPSGRWQARAAGTEGVLIPAPVTFDTKMDAAAWLADADGSTIAKTREVYRLTEYAELWLAGRDLKPRTREGYRQLLDQFILPPLGTVPLGNLTPARVRAWYANLNPSTPTRRAHTYSLLRAMLATALADDLVESNPCRVRGAGSAPRKRKITIATLGELDAIVTAIPAKYEAMVLLAAWCGLRFGELTELRRADLDLDRRLIAVRRGVVRVDGKFVIGEPKSAAGVRDVAVPPHLVPAIRQHLNVHVGSAPTSLLFPARGGGHMTSSALNTVFFRARKSAGREDLRFHDLRHTGATLAAATGATLAELMARMGHSTAGAAIIYQHAASNRDQAIAKALSGLAQAQRTAAGGN